MTVETSEAVTNYFLVREGENYRLVSGEFGGQFSYPLEGSRIRVEELPHPVAFNFSSDSPNVKGREIRKRDSILEGLAKRGMANIFKIDFEDETSQILTACLLKLDRDYVPEGMKDYQVPEVLRA